MAARKYFGVKYALYNTGSVQADSDEDYSDSSLDDANYNHRKNRYTRETSKIEIKTVLKTKSLVKSDTFSDLHVTLHQLARDGNYELLKVFLDNLSLDSAKIKVNELDENKRAPIHYAARYNHKSVVDLLIDRGADVNLVADDGLAPLHFAARYGYNKAPRRPSTPSEERPPNTCRTVICALVTKGAVVNSKDDYGMSPLHYAAMRGNVIATRQLLKSANANTEIYDNQEMTPLHCAVNYNSPEVVELLLNAGAEPQVYDENSSTPLHLAATTGNKEIVMLLLERVEKRDGSEKMLEYLEEKNNSGSTALHLAVTKAHLEVIDILLSKGANVKVTRDNYSQPLHLAAISGNVSSVESLIKYGAKVNCINSFRETPLHKAAAYNASDVIDFLLQNGAEIECRDNEHFTPLLIAASEGHVEAIQRLLSAGANVDVVDKMDRTVVFWAAQEDHPKALKALLEWENASDLVNRCDHYDNSPLHISALKGSALIAEILLNNCAEIEKKNEHEQTPLHMAAKNGQASVIQLLINQSKTIVDTEDENSNTPLHLAALCGHYHSVKLLLHVGANIGARNCYMWTALDCAASRGWKRCCQILLDAGCPVDSVDKAKTTPLHLAAREGHKGIVKLLLKCGANIAQCDKDGRNCLDLAIDKGQIDVALEILSDSNWEAVLRNESDRNKFFVHQTPLRRLVRRMPEVASFVFDRCITKNEFSEDHPKFEVTFSYEFLDDIFACYQPHLYDIDRNNSSSSDSSIFTGSNIYTTENHVKLKVMPYTDDKEILKYNHPLMLMVTHHRESLLSHPLCQSLLMHKWKNYGRYVYYSNLLIFVMFLIFLTGYILTAVPPCPRTSAEGDDPKCCSSRNFTCQPYIGECNYKSEQLFPKVCRNFIYVFALIHLLKEVYQVYQNGRRYFNLENFLEWACYLGALIFVADVSECSAETGIREVWQWELGSLSIFCAWMVLVMFISKFPFLGIYVVMFMQILSTFVNFSFVFFLFVVAFALAFYSLLQNQDPFETPGESIMKTGVMMIGEFEFDAIFNDPDRKVYFKGPTYLLFVIFLLLMSIIIMNLLIGLAVDDIKGVMEKAELKRLAMKVELVLTVERILPLVALRKCVIKKQTVRPNAWHSLPWYWKMLRIKPAPAQTIGKSTLNDLEEKQSKLSRQLKDIKESIHLVQKDLKHIQSSIENKSRQNT